MSVLQGWEMLGAHVALHLTVRWKIFQQRKINRMVAACTECVAERRNYRLLDKRCSSVRFVWDLLLVGKCQVCVSELQRSSRAAVPIAGPPWGDVLFVAQEGWFSPITEAASTCKAVCNFPTVVRVVRLHYALAVVCDARQIYGSGVWWGDYQVSGARRIYSWFIFLVYREGILVVHLPFILG